MQKVKHTARLSREAKRFYIYTYGGASGEGSFTVGKSLLKAENIDFVECLRNGDITVENAPGAQLINLNGTMVDTAILDLISAVLDAYAETKAVPDAVQA